MPFRAETPIAIVYKHINAPLPSPRRLNPDIPPGLESVLLKAMEKDPDKRYQDADRFVEALQDIPILDNPSWILENDLLDRMLAPDLSIHIVKTGEIMPLKDKNRYILGRTDETVVPDIDLASYDGMKQGVSRIHAEITLDHESKVFLTDLKSTNGTWLNGVRIDTQSKVPLNHGDLISLGKLVVQALIYY
jgi:serine/threonine protein kinase